MLGLETNTVTKYDNERRFCRWWQSFMVVLVAYSVWVYPLEVAFMDAIPKRQLLIADSIVDLFFAIDISFTFFVAYIDHHTQLLVRDSKKIAIRLEFSISPFFMKGFLKTCFWFDFLWWVWNKSIF